MKQSFQSLVKGFNWALASLIALIGGFTSCDKDSEDPIVCMYGTPLAVYSIKGKVVNANGAAIQGIEVKAATIYRKEWMQQQPDQYPYKTVTNTNGEFDFQLSTIGAEDFTVYATDIDGDTNGAYRADSTFVKGSNIKLTGGSGAWDQGKGDATVNFTLKENIAIENE